MGNSESQITEERLEEYLQLTFLTKTEILSLYEKFSAIEPSNLKENIMHRIPVELVMDAFPQIKYNPFSDRICDVFSSLKDACFSFEDILDFCSVMSEKCPNHVKALWAFRIFDFNNDSSIDRDDLMEIINRLVDDGKAGDFLYEEKNYIIKILLASMDIENNGNIGQLEFTHAIGKMDDFGSALTFTI
ncbi:putative EF-Hand superfamily Ca2-binding protein [Trypoxylus dichotomus]